MIDTHAHLDMRSFDKDRAETIARARSAGVTSMVTIGIDLESSRKAIQLADTYRDIFATVGFHPHDAARMRDADIDNLAKLARHPKVVAIGEMGLDFYRNRSPREAQFQVLERQLELASKLSLPVVIHSREAEEEMVSVLANWASAYRSSDGNPIGVIHCFSGTEKAAQRYLDMGFFIAFGAYVGYPTSENVHNVIRSIPLDRLVVETDCPFLPPQIYRGKRNEPSYLPITMKAIAMIRGLSPEEMADATTRNARRLFRLE